MSVFTYKIKGIELNLDEMADMHDFYEAACTAEYLMQRHDFNKNEALELGYEVRCKMDDYDYSEEEAINEVLGELKGDDNDE